MWPPRRRGVAVRAAGWLCALLAAAVLALPVSAEVKVYGKLGGEVSFRPLDVSGNITSIVWKEGTDIAMEWIGNEEDRHRHYRERGRLDRASGAMTITGLVESDGKVYTPEINNKEGTPFHLTVISAVPVPTVTKQCDDETASCTLTCSADTAGAGLVEYSWKSDDNVELGSSKEHAIKKDTDEKVKAFTCELKNPVSQESSQPVPNPFTPEPTGEVKVMNGVIIFICLLGAVLLLVAVHRLKAGEWFFEKGSMPWEADFWKKYEPAPRDAAVSNGTAAPQQNPSDEETALA